MRRTSRSSRCRRPKTSPRPPATCSTGSDGDTAMSVEVLMPALSPTMTEGKIARWLKKEGEKVKSGDVLAEIETDKATMEVEAVDEGTLGKVLVPGGTEGVKVNTPIALILEEGEDAGSMTVTAAAKPAQEKPTAEAKAPASAPPAPKTAPRAAEEKFTGATSTVTVRE